MYKALHPSSMVPPGFAVVSASTSAGATTILVRSTVRESHCPSCGILSSWVHSSYWRRIGDLPLAGRAVKLLATVRRFRCKAIGCWQRIFTERFADGVFAPWARRTIRLDGLVHYLGLALGERPAAILFGASCCRSATTLCFASSGDAVVHR